MVQSDKVAIIGVHGTFPQAETLEDFDRIFSDKTDCIGDITLKRIHLNGLDENKKYVQSGYLTDIDYFDYGYFGISKREAACIDPQHRISIEAVCKTIESAGYSIGAMRGTNTAVIVGASDTYYKNLFEDTTGFATTGTMIDTLPGRISYLLDLHGEASIVGTSCSSSMYAVYDAYIKLISGRCDMALAGGVYINFQIFEEGSLENDTTTIGLVSSDGRCKTFEDTADGINTCESVGFVLMKPFENAVKDNDNILAVISGIGANHDGIRSNSFSAPSVTAQTELFEQVWSRAGINPEDIGYIEAHGTGTKIGDPIEIASITEAYKKYTNKKQICPIGSLKTNYAHPGPSAGIAGIIKAIVSLNFCKKYPLRTLNKPNHMIDFENSPVYPIRELEKWNSNKRMIAINSFGVSGTNVHMIMENYENPETCCPEKDEEYLVTVSAKNSEQIPEYKEKIAQSIKENYRLGEISYVLNAGRDDFAFRTSAVVKNKEELYEFLYSEEVPSSIKRVKLVFLCSGDRKFDQSSIDQFRKKYPVFRMEYDKMAQKCNSKKAYTVAVDCAILSQFEAWGIKADVLLGTKLGNASIQCLKNKDNLDNLDDFSEKMSSMPFVEDRYLSYMKNLLDSEEDEIVCVDISGNGILLQKLKEESGFEKIIKIEGSVDSSLLQAVSQMYRIGINVDWKAYYQEAKIRKVLLATYPFLRTSAWPEVINKQNVAEEKIETSIEGNLKDFIRDLWKESLDIEEINDDDDVFDLGANSLISMSILKKILNRTGVEMDFDDLYEYSTVNMLYEYIIENKVSEEQEENELVSKIPVIERSDRMTVSGNQKRMLYIQEDAVNKAVYNMPILYRMEGKLQEEIFVESLKEIMDRHEILHTIYTKYEGEYYQKVLDKYDTGIQIIDATDKSIGDIYEIARYESEKEFNLFKETSVRIVLLKKSDDLHYWLVNIHHIAADGWSLGIFYHEMEVLYNSKLKNREFHLEPIAIQYADFSHYEFTFLNSGEAEMELEYWKRELNGVKGILDFPIDKKRPAIKEYYGATHLFTIGTDIVDKAAEYVKKNNLSMFMLLESVYAILLNKYSRETDICVGIPIANRNQEEVEKIIGFFANTIVVRSLFEKEDTVVSFFKKNKEKILGAFSNSHVSFEEVVKQLTFQRRPSHSVLYQYSFTFQNYAYKEMELEDVAIFFENQQMTSAKFDMNFILRKLDNGINVEVEYDPNLFTAGYVEEISANYINILQTILNGGVDELEKISLTDRYNTVVSEDIADSLF